VERRYAREEGAFSYRNCTFVELGGEVIGMLHAFPMEEEPEETDEPVNPVLQPYTRLKVPGGHYVSAMAVFPEHRGRGLGTRMLEMAKEQAAGLRSRMPAGRPAGLRAQRGGGRALPTPRLRGRRSNPGRAARGHPLYGRGPVDDGHSRVTKGPSLRDYRRTAEPHEVRSPLDHPPSEGPGKASWSHAVEGNRRPHLTNGDLEISPYGGCAAHGWGCGVLPGAPPRRFRRRDESA
jgi:GNAT superfamily N-acetyltransferase